MKKLRIISFAAALLIAALSLASCAMPGTTASTTAETAKPVANVTPKDAAKDIDLTADDPSNDDVKFSFDDEGRVSAIEYKSGDVSYLASYNYRNGKVEVYLFGAETVVDYLLFKPDSEFDKSVGFIEQDGYFFKGYKSLTAEATETETEKEASTESDSDAETSAETEGDTSEETK